jgi:uncharacterized RDD family membrane protein YckC
VPRLIVNPTSANRREIALARTLVSIGRDPSNDLVLPDAMVSRRHAVIEYRGSQYYLRDCNSSNGSVVNGDRVSERSLRDGDLVAIGSARLLFREEREDSGAKVVPHPSSPRFSCPACQLDYRKGDIYCRDCGEKLPEPGGPPKAVCASCGSAVLLPARFCSACGARLSDEADRSLGPAPEAKDAEAASAPLPAERSTEENLPARSTSGALAESLRARPAVAPAPVIASVPASSPLVARSFPASVPDRPRAASADPSTGVSPTLPAAAGARTLAGFLDLGLVGLAEALVGLPLASYWWSRELPRSPADIWSGPVLATVALGGAALAAGVAYFVYFWGVRGATPGKRMLGLEVVGEDGRAPIGAARAGARLFGYLLSATSLGLGFLLIPLTGVGLHDRLAGTRVVVRRARD